MTEIGDYSAVELLGMLRSGELAAREAVEWHIDQIQAVHPAINAVVVPLFDQAVVAASAADDARARRSPLGALHGLPVTVKECFDVAGVATTGGVSAMAGRPATSDSAIVRALRREGAIILGKTNLSQLVWFTESDNPIFGRTNNPWNLERSPGGSSGGEAAIVAARGSPLGVGTDSGGSVRMPAHCCGVHAFKPTNGTLSDLGTVDNRLLAGSEARLFNQPGPIARRVADLRAFLSALSDRDACNPRWGDEADVQKLLAISGLKVGVEVDGPIPSSPAVRRAVLEAAEILQERGAIIEVFTAPEISDGLRLFAGAFSADGGARLRSALCHSPRDGRVAAALKGMEDSVLSLAQYWQLVDECDRYRATYAEAFADAGLDILLSPAFALPATPHGWTTRMRGDGHALASLHSLLGAPAGVVAATRVRPGEEHHRGRGTDARGRALTDVETGSAGLPVGVQVVGRHRCDDDVLTVMAALEESFREQDDYPAEPVLQLSGVGR